MKAILSKLNFSLNRNPEIAQYKNIDPNRYIPKSYEAVLIISSDFELAWAWRYAKGFRNPYTEAINRARTARRNIPKILNLCDEHHVPITWATVGHLFLDGCRNKGSSSHSHVHRIPYHENEHWRFDRGDWFDDDPCSDWKSSPEWYAPDLIRMILGANIHHEIACHTFSHIDCRDDVCSDGVFTGEIEECRRYGRKYGIELESFVHPGNMIGNLTALRDLGFTSFRTDYGNVLGYPQMHLGSLWEFRGTMELTVRKGWSIDYHVYRYKKIVERAVRHRRVCCLWFHPSTDTSLVERILPPLFEFITSHRDKLYVTTAKEYAFWLRQRDDS